MIANQIPVLSLMMKGMVLRWEMIDKMSSVEQMMIDDGGTGGDDGAPDGSDDVAEPKEALMFLTKSDDDPHLGGRLVALLETGSNAGTTGGQPSGELQGMGQEN